MEINKCPYRANHECKQNFIYVEAHLSFCSMCLKGMLCDETGLNTTALINLTAGIEELISESK
jgi:hypothetical protein